MSHDDAPPAAMDIPPAHDIGRRRVDALKVAISLCLCYTLCVSFIRVWIRRNLYGWDDWVTLAATVLSLGQYGVVYVAIGKGLGRPIDVLQQSPDLFALNKANYAGLVLWIISLFASKCAAIVFMSRFARLGRHNKEIVSMLIVVAILGLGSILALVVDCPVVGSVYYWDFPSHLKYCPNPRQRWQAIVGFDAITESLMLAVPIDLIWSLQMPRKKKVGIITAFYIRVPVLALTLVRNHYIQGLQTDVDAGLVSRTIVIWQEAELAYSIAAVTLMCLKPLVRDFNTSFGLGGEMVRTHGATGYIAANSNGSQGLGSRIGRLMGYRGEGRSEKGSIIQMESRGGDVTLADKTHVVVVERIVDEPNSSMSTTVTHDPQHKPHNSDQSRGPDDIVVTHRVEQSVSPRNMI